MAGKDSIVQYRIAHHRNTVLLAAVLAVLVGPLTQRAWAQTEPNWEILRQQTPTTTDERVIREWLTAQIDQAITPQSSRPARTAGKAFYDKLTKEHDAANATPGFKSTLARLTAEVYLGAYKGLNLTGNNAAHPLGRLYVMIALTDFGQDSAQPVYEAVLPRDPSSSNRERAATGLLRLKPDMEAQQKTAIRQMMQAVGLKETNGVVLSRIYSFLRETDAAEAAKTLPIVMAILEARFQRFEQDWALPQFADAEAAIWLGERHGAVEADQQKTAIVRTLARLLADATQVYAHQTLPAAERWGVEYVIQASEFQLKAVTDTSGNNVPNVSDAMDSNRRDGREEQAAAMLTELDKWIGSTDSNEPGRLNGDPYKFPIELGIKRSPAPDSESETTEN